MARKLLVVHPRTLYDETPDAKRRIQKLAGSYASRDVFVAFDDEENAVSYMNRQEAQYFESYGGALSTNAYNVLRNCRELMICGHNFDACHRRAFEDVVEYADLMEMALDIKIPTYLSAAASREETQDRLIKARTAEIARGKRVHLSVVRELLSPQLSHESQATIDCTTNYLMHCKQRRFSFDFYVGRELAAHMQRGSHKINIFVENDVPEELR